MNDVANKWEKTGLLEGLPKDQKEGCAHHLEKMGKFLIKKTRMAKGDTDFAGMALPVVRRIYEDGLRNNMPDTKWLCDDLAKHIKKSKLKREDCYIGIDYEAELCAEYTEDLVKRKSKS